MTTAVPNKSHSGLLGLVLAGGKSLRMGQDKSRIDWHGKEQKYYMADMLAPFCDEVYISCRPEQKQEIDPQYKTITDSVPGAGPLVAILSVFQAFPAATWLVVACDLPLLDEPTLQYLVANRNIDKIATTFKSPFDTLPEPLITIWEPSAYPVLQEHIGAGFSCPRKALIRNVDNVQLLTPPDEDALLNANTPGDAEKVKDILNRRKNILSNDRQ